MAVDESGNEVTYDNGAWSAPDAIDSGGMGLISVSCPASTTVPAPFCVTVDLSGNAVTDNNGTWGTPSAIDTVGLPDSVSCTSSTFCMAIDLEGNYLTYNGTSWTAPAPIISGTIFMVSRLVSNSSTFCAAIGKYVRQRGDQRQRMLTWNWHLVERRNTAEAAAVGSFDEGAISCSSATFCQSRLLQPGRRRVQRRGLGRRLRNRSDALPLVGVRAHRSSSAKPSTPRLASR